MSLSWDELRAIVEQYPKPRRAKRAGLPGRRRVAPGPDHWRWKGDAVSVEGLHQWLRVNHPKTGVCEHCGVTPEPRRGRPGFMAAGTDFAFLRHAEPYTRNRDDYIELCPACHGRMDADRRRRADA